MSQERRIAAATRRTLADTVASAFIPTEESAEATAAHGAKCISVMIEQRRTAMLPPEAGAEALVLIAKGTHEALQSHLSFATAHKLLTDIPGQYGLPMGFGPDCAPNTPLFAGGLAAVA